MLKIIFGAVIVYTIVILFGSNIYWDYIKNLLTIVSKLRVI